MQAKEGTNQAGDMLIAQGGMIWKRPVRGYRQADGVKCGTPSAAMNCLSFNCRGAGNAPRVQEITMFPSLLVFVFFFFVKLGKIKIDFVVYVIV